MIRLIVCQIMERTVILSTTSVPALQTAKTCSPAELTTLTQEWAEIRRHALHRDNHRCIACECDLREVDAHVHHALPRAAGDSSPQ